MIFSKLSAYDWSPAKNSVDVNEACSCLKNKSFELLFNKYIPFLLNGEHESIKYPIFYTPE